MRVPDVVLRHQREREIFRPGRRQAYAAQESSKCHRVYLTDLLYRIAHQAEDVRKPELQKAELPFVETIGFPNPGKLVVQAAEVLCAAHGVFQKSGLAVGADYESRFECKCVPELEVVLP